MGNETSKYNRIVAEINSKKSKLEILPDKALSGLTSKLRELLHDGTSMDIILPYAFAVCKEAARRALGMEHFDVQLIGGLVLNDGDIAEMKTGEGKTLVATLAAYLNALDGRGVHIITVNEYLADRDAYTMGKVFSLLGLTTSCIKTSMSDDEKRAAYQADIIYGTASEFGFDYLRDNMVTKLDEKVQRELNYAIIDEVDSVLIDEARTPLIISQSMNDNISRYTDADSFVNMLDSSDYEIAVEEKKIYLTEDGLAKAERVLGIKNLTDISNIESYHYIIQALTANYILQKDVDYIVKNDEILIVDEFTGRVMEGRRFSDGLHQALEAKENVTIRGESKTVATISLQNYFRLYNKLSGMTGTGKSEEAEFIELYNMRVTQIPTNRPMIRVDHVDKIYRNRNGKWKAVAREIARIHSSGRPILVGTTSVENSEIISSMLNELNIKHRVLNAKNDLEEAGIIAQAGRIDSVTVATNMAGRGTDILLGGNPELLSKAMLRHLKSVAAENRNSNAFEECRGELAVVYKYQRITLQMLDKIYKEKCREERNKVVALGGLYVIGTARHESVRIDNQLRGRAGRQGDPGDSEFFVALDDELTLQYGGEELKKIIDRFYPSGKHDTENYHGREDNNVDSRQLQAFIKNTQKKVESEHYSARKRLIQYDDVINTQRDVIYSERDKVLRGEDMAKAIDGMMEYVVSNIVYAITDGRKNIDKNDFYTLNKYLKIILRFDLTWINRKQSIDRDVFIEQVIEQARARYTTIETELGSGVMRYFERYTLLRTVDAVWSEHVEAIAQLRRGIGLQALAGKDPVVEFAREAREMFEIAMNEIRSQTVKSCYSVNTSR